MTLNKKQSSLSSLNHHEFSHGSLAYMINNLDLSKKENMNSTHNILRIILKKDKAHNYFYFIERIIENLLKTQDDDIEDDFLMTLFKGFLKKIVFRADLKKETLKTFELLFTKHINKKNNLNFVDALAAQINLSKKDKINKLLPEISRAIKNSKDNKKTQLRGRFEIIINTELRDLDNVLNSSNILINERLSFFPIVFEFYLNKDIEKKKFEKILKWLFSSCDNSQNLSFSFKNDYREMLFKKSASIKAELPYLLKIILSIEKLDNWLLEVFIKIFLLHSNRKDKETLLETLTKIKKPPLNSHTFSHLKALILKEKLGETLYLPLWMEEDPLFYAFMIVDLIDSKLIANNIGQLLKAYIKKINRNEFKFKDSHKDILEYLVRKSNHKENSILNEKRLYILKLINALLPYEALEYCKLECSLESFLESQKLEDKIKIENPSHKKIYLGFQILEESYGTSQIISLGDIKAAI